MHYDDDDDDDERRRRRAWQVQQDEFMKTRQSNHCGFSIHIFDNSKSKSMVRLVRAEMMVLSGLGCTIRYLAVCIIE